MSAFDFNKQAPNIMVWLLLLTMPFWLSTGRRLYPSSARQVVVLGLAAMALNFLLGYTGVLSFGHAAYFGLGAYGAAHDHPLSGAEHGTRHRASARSSARSPPRSSAR